MKCDNCIHNVVCVWNLTGSASEIQRCVHRVEEGEEGEVDIESEVVYPKGYHQPRTLNDFVNLLGLPGNGGSRDSIKAGAAHGVVYKNLDDYKKLLPQREAYSEMVRAIAEDNHNDGQWKADWECEDQDKYLFGYSHRSKKIIYHVSYWVKIAHERDYCSEKAYHAVLNRLGEAKIKLALGIENK